MKIRGKEIVLSKNTHKSLLTFCYARAVALRSIFREYYFFTFKERLIYSIFYSRLAKCRSGGMAYTHDSKSCAARLKGSSPFSGTLVVLNVGNKKTSRAKHCFNS